MKNDNKKLIEEVNALKNEVKMLRAIVQSLMTIFTEENDMDMDFEDEMDENIPFPARPQTQNYVS